MKLILLGILFALIGLMIALFIGNIVIWVMLRDLPWLRLFRAKHDVEVLRNVFYVAGSRNPKHRLDIYRPRGKKGCPVVHFIHGGYWITGDKEYYLAFTGLYANIGVAFARRGICAVVQSYRLAPSVSFEDVLGDVRAGIAWTQRSIAEFGGDPEKMVLMGHSAGGHLSAYLAADREALAASGIRPEGIKGFISLSGIFDLEDMSKAHDATFNEQVTYSVFGRDPATLLRWSPLANFRVGMPPTLLLVGERDFPYLRPQAERAAERLKQLNNDRDFHIVPGYTHMDMVIRFGREPDPVLDHVLAFIEKTAMQKK